MSTSASTESPPSFKQTTPTPPGAAPSLFSSPAAEPKSAKSTLSLWLLVKGCNRQLRPILDEYAHKAGVAPIPEPHLTLTSFTCQQSEYKVKSVAALELASQLQQKLQHSKLATRFGEVVSRSSSEAPFMCLYARLERSDALVELHSTTCDELAKLGVEPSRVTPLYEPHVSLLYDTQQKVSHQQLDEWRDELNQNRKSELEKSLNALVFELQLVDTTNADYTQWPVLGTWNF